MTTQNPGHHLTPQHLRAIAHIADSADTLHTFSSIRRMCDPLLWHLAPKSLAPTASFATVGRNQVCASMFRMSVYLVFRFAGRSLKCKVRARRPDDSLSVGIPADKAVAVGPHAPRACVARNIGNPKRRPSRRLKHTRGTFVPLHQKRGSRRILAVTSATEEHCGDAPQNINAPSQRGP
jgi:hypothetical protein